MKVMTILGTRPEIIRLSLIIKKLDKCTEHILVHTGQNYSKCLNDIFFSELELRQPDYYLGAGSERFGSQMAVIFKETEELLLKLKPDKILILGDTNSGLAAIAAERAGIPVYHMEAGNRCFDIRVPEEINRRIIDSISRYALPYTNWSRENLINEGIHKNRIFICGNPIYEIIRSNMDKIENSKILDKLDLSKCRYFLATAHRAENVDIKERLGQILHGMDFIQKKFNMPVIFSVHPRTRDKITRFGLDSQNKNIIFSEPFGFFDFIWLEKNAACVLTDSGTVQEECCIFKIPTVTMRDSTERPETVECGSNIISGPDAEKILRCSEIMMEGSREWKCPAGYLDKNVSDRVVKFILGESIDV